MVKKAVKQTYQQLLNTPKEKLIADINSMVSTVNTRLRRLYNSGLQDSSRFMAEKMPTLLQYYGTGSGRVRKASKKSSIDELAQQALAIQKIYNASLTTREIKQEIKAVSERMGVSTDSIKLLYSLLSNGIVSHLFREYGTDLPRIIDNRQQAGQSNQEILDDLQNAINNNNESIDIMVEFAGEGGEYLLN